MAPSSFKESLIIGGTKILSSAVTSNNSPTTTPTHAWSCLLRSDAELELSVSEMLVGSQVSFRQLTFTYLMLGFWSRLLRTGSTKMCAAWVHAKHRLCDTGILPRIRDIWWCKLKHHSEWVSDGCRRERMEGRSTTSKHHKQTSSSLEKRQRHLGCGCCIGVGLIGPKQVYYLSRVAVVGGDCALAARGVEERVVLGVVGLAAGRWFSLGLAWTLWA